MGYIRQTFPKNAKFSWSENLIKVFICDTKQQVLLHFNRTYALRSFSRGTQEFVSGLQKHYLEKIFPLFRGLFWKKKEVDSKGSPRISWISSQVTNIYPTFIQINDDC